jgi:glycerol uptake facilitator-like aquaporin
MIATLVAEFLGTGALTLMILSVQRSNIGVPFFVAIAAGLMVTLMTFALWTVSGAHFNPALTIAAWTGRKISTVNAVLFVAAQMLGAWGAYYLYTYYVKNGLQPVGGHFSGRILTGEAVGAGLFAFGWAAANYQRVTTGATAAFAGLAYMVGIVTASTVAIGLLNPAVALGIRSWVWGTYVLGPVVGAVIGFNLYNLLFARPDVEAAAVAAKAVPTAATRTTTSTVKKPAAKKSAARKKTSTRKK